MVLVVDRGAAHEAHASRVPLPAGFAEQDLHRPPAVVTADALFRALDDLHGVGGHLFQGLEADEVDLVHAPQPCRRSRDVVLLLAQHRAGHVVRHVAAADHDDPGSELDGLAEGHVAQEVDAAEDADGVRARDRQGARALRADGDDHGRVVAAQLVERDVLPHLRVAADLHAERLDDGDLGANQIGRQTVAGHAGVEHARGHRFHLEDGRTEAHQREIVAGREAGGTGADDGHRLASRARELVVREEAQEVAELVLIVAQALRGGLRHGGELALGRFRAGFGAVSFADEPLQRANGDRLIDGSAAAGGLAGRAADAAADGRQGVRPAGDQVGPLVVAVGDSADVAARVGVHGAGELALDLLAPVRVVGHPNSVGPVHRPRSRAANAADVLAEITQGLAGVL